ncbi:MAG: hypothetical protein QG610_372 [Euryarchaeota archaeon]|nr:hypothetical protein [Euryarchaeota archaeon]
MVAYLLLKDTYTKIKESEICHQDLYWRYVESFESTFVDLISS